MNKVKYLKELKRELRKSKTHDVDKFLSYYSEMIDDKIEDGMSEEEAISSIGLPKEIINQINGEYFTEKSKTATKKNKQNPWLIVLIAVGSPIWLSLIISVLAVALSLFVCFLAVIISIYASILAILIGGICGIITFIIYIIYTRINEGIVLLGTGIFLIGLTPILLSINNKLFKLFILSIKGSLNLTKTFLAKRS